MLLFVVELVCSEPNCLRVLFARNAAIPLPALLKHCTYSFNFVDVHPIKLLFHHDGGRVSMCFSTAKIVCFVYTQSKRRQHEEKKNENAIPG